MESHQIRPMKPGDWGLVKAIYDEGMQSGNATFETSAGSWEKWDTDHMQEPRLVCEMRVPVVGWAALSPVSDRCAYGGVADVSVYVSAGARGHGIGSALLKRLVEESESQGLWTLQAGIFPENEASIHLHKKAGFRIVGTREKLGKMDGRWRDVVLMERRSENVF